LFVRGILGVVGGGFCGGLTLVVAVVVVEEEIVTD
jgi:hypothetical protein